ncbi:DNA-3-methyladenine glycosylase [Anaerocolumna aminovalerica]|jgi:DNA-3-methyladenine glycosylase|uniref:Putative 3-methyladenine DNA glycosylase n=2 Tax=Anaerocolumna aminovalerica TaxID=1527 RepID=A0A1I5GLU2_9FIRM|nr:DNA-3-methyladenine glycosylase [Anaerocolumna aminovalerica]SFO36531.1 DNA-3-methyladenine glycosylase [Anaerocolumna aminovalerica]
MGVYMKVTRDFYQRSAVEVAKDLLGLVLVHETKEGITKGIIVETEAYMGPKDAAAHSYKNIRSQRTEIQYGEGGYAYIYLIYGMYYCMNIVTNKEEIPEVVLLRALEPVEGIDLMKQRRKTDKLKNLCSGPGKLCAAMGIDKNNYGMDLCGNKLYLEYQDSISYKESINIVSSKRINIDYAGEAKDYLWRYTIENNEYVSVKDKKVLKK